MSSHSDMCPCFSLKPYEVCCSPYHEQKAQPPTAEALMRARYSAYALSLPDYLIETTHPMSPHYHPNRWLWRRQLVQYCRRFEGVELKIIETQECGDQSAVLFFGILREEGADHAFYELSRFEKVRGAWKYKWGYSHEGTPPPSCHIDRADLLPLAYYDHPVLRQKGAPIAVITSEIKELVARMIATMNACDALGLAAPQVHHSLQLFVMRVPIEAGDSYSLGPVAVFINPRLSDFSQETWKTVEGCLSIPGLQEEVERPRHLTVEYMDLEGHHHRRHVSGWEARVICHEYDHLQGVLFIDSLTKGKREKIAPFLQSLNARWTGP